MSLTTDNMCNKVPVDEEEVKELIPKAIIGFDGKTRNGLIVHPNGKHIVYPMGNKVTIQELQTHKQKFLSGHTNIISAVALSKSGRFIASGQINHIGFKASVIIWDFEKAQIIHQHEHHKVRVESVVFSTDEKFLISLGGRDCGSIIIWDINQGQLICGTHASRGIQGEACVLLPMTRRGECFITAGDCHMSVWKIDKKARSISSTDVSMCRLKRQILCIDANERDEMCYCGTSTGDILKIRLNFHHDLEVLEPVKPPCLIGCFARITRKKLPRGSVDLYQSGVRAIRRLFTGQLIVGAGDGTLEMVEEAPAQLRAINADVKLPSVPALQILKSTNVNSAVTSIQLMKETNIILVGTTSSEIYSVNLTDFRAELIVTCHTASIYDIAFPHNFSDVFATASMNNVRVWSTSTMQELLRIRVPNFYCSNVVFSYDGKSILTAWNDGVIRSFTPLTGRLIYAILNAHNKGVSALTTTEDGRLLISGGCEGQVRLWSVCPYKQELICTLKEHKGPVSAVDINKFGTEAASASTDGTCIIWDLERQCRRQILFANTLFMCVKYYPSGVQILTGGSDRKISYWEVLDGCLVRELEGSPTGTINTLDISPDGDSFVTGGNDQILKLWLYQEGVTTHIGLGHSAVITAVKFSANGKFIVTTSASGSIFMWENPHYKPKPRESVKQLEKLNEELKIANNKDDEHISDLALTARSNASVTSKKSNKSCECKSSSSSRSSNNGSGDSNSKKSSVRSVKSNTGNDDERSVKSDSDCSKTGTSSKSSSRSSRVVKIQCD